MKEKIKAKEILTNALKVWDYKIAKQKALESCQQIKILAPLTQKDYWKKVENELLKLKIE